MKFFYLTKNDNLGEILNQATHFDFKVIKILREDEVFEHDFEKCVLVIDIDEYKEHGFTLASKLSTMPDRKALIIGITTLDVDFTDSKFDFFFESFESVMNHFDEIVAKYEKI
jgi:hypothetical protein